MAKKGDVLEIHPLKIERTALVVEGVTPLIVHAWSRKAKQEMLDKQMNKTKTGKKAAKNPVEDFMESLYWLTPKPSEYTEEAFNAAVEAGARFGFPATAVKKAAISGAYRSGVTKNMASVRGMFFIEGELSRESGEQLIEIKYEELVPREDMVRIAMNTADIRFRGEFRGWSMTLNLTYNARGQYTLEQIINMINIGGYATGIGEWRPERDGQYGMFQVKGS